MFTETICPGLEYTVSVSLSGFKPILFWLLVLCCSLIYNCAAVFNCIKPKQSYAKQQKLLEAQHKELNGIIGAMPVTVQYHV